MPPARPANSPRAAVSCSAGSGTGGIPPDGSDHIHPAAPKPPFADSTLRAALARFNVLIEWPASVALSNTVAAATDPPLSSPRGNAAAASCAPIGSPAGSGSFAAPAGALAFIAATCSSIQPR